MLVGCGYEDKCQVIIFMVVLRVNALYQRDHSALFVALS